MKTTKTTSTTKQYVRDAVTLDGEVMTVPSRVPVKNIIGCFDIETTTDTSQTARIGGYCFIDSKTGCIIDIGIICNYDALTSDEIATIRLYQEKRDDILTHDTKLGLIAKNILTNNYLTVLSMEAFINDRLYPTLKKGHTIINHNIAFDISRLMPTFSIKDGKHFQFACSCVTQPCKNHPPITVQRLIGKKSLFYVDTEAQGYGAILDTMILGTALLGANVKKSLSGMGENFKAPIRKIDADGHGMTIDNNYISYMMNDVLATISLFIEQQKLYRHHQLASPIHNIMSEASIGKAYFQKLGVIPFRQAHKYIPQAIYDIAIQSYYGARSEVRMPKHPSEIRYCDFKSMYPTINALLGLQSLLIAEHIDVVHCKNKAQAIVDAISIEHLQKPDTWKHLRIMVKIAADDDILPGRYSKQKTGTITTLAHNTVENDDEYSWYTMCDAIASKILHQSNKSPHIVDAIELIPSGQQNTNTIMIFGSKKYTIDMGSDDFFTKLIDLRTDIKKEMRDTLRASEEYLYLDSLQNALKLIANATSYGVLVESHYQNGYDVAGKYYASPIATHITGGARLLLAIAEKLGYDSGLKYAMCDTDSMAFACPSTMSRQDFRSSVSSITSWFKQLSPYADKNADIFELEDVNYIDKEISKKLGYSDGTIDDTLYFLGVSCKRYCLYNRLPDNRYLLRKVSAHATGRFQFDKDMHIPKDILVVHELISDENNQDDLIEDDDSSIAGNIGNWQVYQHIMWYRAVQQAEKGVELHVPREKWSSNMVRYQETINSPDKLRRHSFIPGIKPFNFLTETAVQVITGSNKERKATIKMPYRYVYAYKSTQDELLASQAYRSHDGKPDANPIIEPLYERFKNFFSHNDEKFLEPDKDGFCSLRIEHINATVKRMRNGMKATIEPE